jgi:hypothetical protein
MGRAYRVLKLTAHLTVHVSERPEKVVAVAAAGEAVKKKRSRQSPVTSRQSKKKTAD